MPPLQFLVELAQKPMPLAVTCPRQLGHVTRLKAIGLIEATLAVSHSRDRRTHAALVHNVTESGIREITESTGRTPTAPRPSDPSSIGPTFLRFLEHADFPVIVTLGQECDIAARLLIHGWIHGAIDDVGDSPATVIRGLTTAGRAALCARTSKAMEVLRPSAPSEAAASRPAAAISLASMSPHAVVARQQAVGALV